MTLLKELIRIDEVVEPVDATLELEQQLEILEQRMAAAKRGLGFSNKLKNPAQKKKHIALVLTNLNKIRANLSRVINQMEQFDNAVLGHEEKFNKAQAEYERGSDLETPGE